MTSLSAAQADRLARGEMLVDRRIDGLLDSIGLSETDVEKLAVGPDARKKLSGILKRLASKDKPFTQCMRDLRKHRPELTDESRKRICGRLKSMVKGTGRARAALSLSQQADDSCPLIDADVFTLLMNVDDDKLSAALTTEEAS